MSQQEAPLGVEPCDAVEADLPPQTQHAAPQTHGHRRRQDNGGSSEGGSRPTRTRHHHHHSSSSSSSSSNNNNGHGGDNGQQQQQQQQHPPARYRRYDPSEASRPRGQRRATEGDAEAAEQHTQQTVQSTQGQQAQPQQPIPRPAVSRYRRQGDNEARLRAQQQRQRQRQQREAERAERSERAEREEVQQQRHAPPVQPQPQAPPPAAPPAEREEAEEDDGALNRSASTESAFHNHTDRAEGDADMALEPPEPEDESGYGLTLRPEADEYAESAESEQLPHPHPAQQPQPQHPPQAPPLPRDPLPNTERPRTLHPEAPNPGSGYSNYVYTQPAYRVSSAREGAGPTGGGGGGGEVHEATKDEPYADYSPQEHVYEEIAEAAAHAGGGPECQMQQQQQRCRQRQQLSFRQFEREDSGGSTGSTYRQQEAVGSRLHHYDERSDGESDSPEKEAEFAPYPRSDSCEREHEDEDIDQIVAEVKESLSSQSLQRAAMGLEGEEEGEEEEGEWPESEHSVQTAQEDQDQPMEPADEEGEEMMEEEEDVEVPLPNVSPGERPAQQRISREKRDAISLAIKDIKEAIEEVKTRTVRSPYTPDEPKEPIWVMRQDLSPTAENDLQPSLGGDSPGSGSNSPQGAESSSHHMPMLEGSDSFETPSPAGKESRRSLASFPTYVEVPGPCDPEDLIDGIIFAANYLGSTQLLSDKTPSKNVRMMQAQEAVSRIKTAQKLAKSRKKAPEGEAQPMTEVDLFISTQRIKVLNADSQETMMDHPLRTISYIADIGNIVVLMARRRMPRPDSQENLEASDPAQDEKRQYKMICHVFESEDAQLIAQSIGQAFSVAYQEFLRANGINPEDLSQKEYSDLLNTQDMYNDDLIHFSKSENCKDVYIEKQKGEILGLVIVESGWGSILPTVIIANMMHAGPAEKSGRLNIGDQIMSINGTSLVGLPLSTCQTIIKGLKNQSRIKLNIVRCPPVTTVLIRRPDLRYQLGFSVQNGIICSLMRGGIAERGGVRVGHRIIEINGQSVVATPHEKIVHILSNAVGEIHMKTMPAAMYRLLTAQEQPVYI
ncbi:amyloid-beta A4 precursor protein-binding family A member 1 isoform X1 [Alosa sapidissima]|uniref:amyloid-beta A4 precursor protein-binding family A member 1 isoform X1 n=1 Tax=Alosa sapidissima TaxID=34773 RepID=UPI001C097DF1|nr:amyloid-beta A4 precursor protein-binding family A member 1 isoform X1 [Alosa sapidissima]XP_041956956.1 amyloid-beta A4 precursor protein-binding family A member 1 isoform X1 [Alosa sapidissima]XP_041956957.1 amyloid-beta A4 precursor protein-binding family A member 1 isoform X1 [Alosa sapidissima]